MNYNHILYSALIIGGVAIVINGFVGKSIRNDVEVPLSKEERENSQPPTRLARFVYITFGLILCGDGISHLVP